MSVYSKDCLDEELRLTDTFDQGFKIVVVSENDANCSLYSQLYPYLNKIVPTSPLSYWKHVGIETKSCILIDSVADKDAFVLLKMVEDSSISHVFEDLNVFLVKPDDIELLKYQLNEFMVVKY